MQLILRTFCFSLFFFFLMHFSAQEFTPVVTQFTKNDYKAAKQNWAVAQDSDGIMYFGNTLGLLTFDGCIWKLIKIPQNKIVRSLYIDDDDRIYIGSYEEFGYFEKDDKGQLHYFSLSEKMAGYKMQNDEIWCILNVNGNIIFQSFTSYFIYRDEEVKAVKSPYMFMFFSVFNENIYTYTNHLGLVTVDIEKSDFLPVPTPFKSPLMAILPYDSTRSLFVTKSDGLFLYDGKLFSVFENEANEILKKIDINRAVVSKDGSIIVGSILNGVIAIGKNGEKQWAVNTENMLQNNTVLGMYSDRNGNLWLALDKGISFLQFNPSIRYINSLNPFIGSIYSVCYDNSDLYMGTNQGLYRAELSGNKKAVNNIRLDNKIRGQVWDVSRFDDQIICGGNDESYELTRNETTLISPVKGGVCIKKGIIHGQEVLVQGTYSQLCIYKKERGKWVFSHALDDFINPVRYLEIDYRGTIWAGHLHHYLYEIRLSPDLKNIESIKTTKSLDGKNEYPIHVFSINSRVVFADRTAFYTYDDIREEIIPFRDLNDKLGYFSTAYRVCHFKKDLYWFITPSEVALVQVNPNDVKILDVISYALFNNQTVDDYQNIVSISDNECLFTLENGGLVLYTDSVRVQMHPVSLKMKEIAVLNPGNNQKMQLPVKDDAPVSFPHDYKNIVFTVLYPQYEQMDNVFFRYKLTGLEQMWSEPVTSSQKEYNYLDYGKYVFSAEVLTKNGQKLSEINYAFEITPPFYLSKAAHVVYMILICILLCFLYLFIRRLIRKKEEKVRAEQEEIRRKEIEKQEQQIILLEKEKLESELTLKSKDLAASTMNLIKKNEILIHLKSEIINQKETLGTQYPNKYYNRLIYLIDENLSSEDDWAIFQTNFDRIHENFFRNLRIKYPELTSNDLRLCAYLRLNLSSKDIANLMNISLKGVEVARYRVRKKIKLPSDKSLTEFMIEFK